MSDRRRNGLILLVVLGLLIASFVVILTQPTKEGLDLKGGVQLVYQGKPTPQQPKVTQDALDRAVDIIRERVDQLGVSEPEIQRAGSDQIEVGLPDVKNAQRALQQVGKVAQLYFYDWEANVLGADGKPHPADAKVTGGPSAGSLGLPEYQALKIAGQAAADEPEDGDHRRPVVPGQRQDPDRAARPRGVAHRPLLGEGPACRHTRGQGQPGHDPGARHSRPARRARRRTAGTR